MLQSQPIPLMFPLKGVNENQPYAAPPGSTITRPENVQNCRAYDALERRNRGGQRTGISKMAGEAVNGSNQIQLLEPVVLALDLVQNAAWSDQLNVPSVALKTFESEPLEWNNDSDRIVLKGSSVADVQVYSVDDAEVATLSASHTLTVGGSVYDFRWNLDGSVLFVCTDLGATNQVRAYPYDKTTGFGSLLDSVTPAGNAQVHLGINPDGDVVVAATTTTPYIHAWPWDGSSFGTKYSDAATSPGKGVSANAGGRYIVFHPDGDNVFINFAGDIKGYKFDKITGWGTKYTDPAAASSFYSIEVNATGTFIISGAGNALAKYPFDKSTGFGARVLESTGGVAGRGCAFSPDGNYVAVAGQGSGASGIWPFTTSLGTKLTTPGTLGGGPYTVRWSPDGTKTAWLIGSGGTTNRGLVVYNFTPAGVNPLARETRIVTMSGGSMYRSSTDLATYAVVSSGSNAFDPSNPQPMADTNFQKLFVTDGVYANYQYLDFADNTLKDWTSDLSAGSLPQGTYRGRTVLSGLKEEPQNWFMSRAGDPFDFDYSPATPDALQPVAGNNSDAGELGDIITALAPYQDDVLIMGGANSVWVMRGDPAAGGRIDNITRGVGIVGPEAWCFDNAGTFYFFAINGLYRMSAGGASVELVSKGRLDKTFSDVDTTVKVIRLAYDSKWQGVGIFISDPSDPAAAPTHYFYDERNDAFFPDKYPVDIGPSALATLFDTNPENNTVILGGFDSYIRKFDDTSMNDDGTAIDSFFRLPTVHPGLTMGQIQLSDLQINLDAGGGASTTLDIFQGNTPEEAAVASAAAYTVTLVAGRNLPHRKRLRANALSMQLKNNTVGETWAYEAGNALVGGVGRVRATL